MALEPPKIGGNLPGNDRNLPGALENGAPAHGLRRQFEALFLRPGGGDTPANRPELPLGPPQNRGDQSGEGDRARPQGRVEPRQNRGDQNGQRPMGGDRGGDAPRATQPPDQLNFATAPGQQRATNQPPTAFHQPPQLHHVNAPQPAQQTFQQPPQLAHVNAAPAGAAPPAPRPEEHAIPLGRPLPMAPLAGHHPSEAPPQAHQPISANGQANVNSLIHQGQRGAGGNATLVLDQGLLPDGAHLDPPQGQQPDSAKAPPANPEQRRQQIQQWAAGNADGGRFETDGARVAKALLGQTSLGELNPGEQRQLVQQAVERWTTPNNPSSPLSATDRDAIQVLAGVAEHRPTLGPVVGQAMARRAVQFIADPTTLGFPPQAARELAGMLAASGVRASTSDSQRQRLVESLNPQGAGHFAKALTHRPGEALPLLQALVGHDHPAARAFIAETLNHTAPEAYQQHPELADTIARSLAHRWYPDDPQSRAQAAARFSALLNTSAGQELVGTQSVPLLQRQQVLEILHHQPRWDSQTLTAYHGPGWSHPGVMTELARGRAELLAQLQEGGDPPPLNQLVAAALGTALKDNGEPPRELLPVLAAIRRAGGERPQVTALPLQLANELLGAVPSALFRVTGSDGKPLFVDSMGQRFESLEAWRKGNQYPPGNVTYPTAGKLARDGQGRLKLSSEDTPNTPAQPELRKILLDELFGFAGDAVIDMLQPKRLQPRQGGVPDALEKRLQQWSQLGPEAKKPLALDIAATGKTVLTPELALQARRESAGDQRAATPATVPPNASAASAPPAPAGAKPVDGAMELRRLLQTRLDNELTQRLLREVDAAALRQLLDKGVPVASFKTLANYFDTLPGRLGERMSELADMPRHQVQAAVRAVALELLDGGRTLQRNGPQVDMALLERQVQRGITPDGEISYAEFATRFKSYEDWLETRQAAFNAISQIHQVNFGADFNIPPAMGMPNIYSIILEHGKPIDEGIICMPGGRTVPGLQAIDADGKDQFMQDGRPLVTHVCVETSAVDGVSRSLSTIVWDPDANGGQGRWVLTQHTPYARGWTQSSRRYVDPIASVTAV